MSVLKCFVCAILYVLFFPFRFVFAAALSVVLPIFTLGELIHNLNKWACKNRAWDWLDWTALELWKHLWFELVLKNDWSHFE